MTNDAETSRFFLQHTKYTGEGVGSQDLTESWSRGISRPIILKFDRRLGSDTTEAPGEFQSNTINQTINLTDSIVHKTLRYNILSDIETSVRMHYKGNFARCKWTANNIVPSLCQGIHWHTRTWRRASSYVTRCWLFWNIVEYQTHGNDV